MTDTTVDSAMLPNASHEDRVKFIMARLFDSSQFAQVAKYIRMGLGHDACRWYLQIQAKQVDGMQWTHPLFVELLTLVGKLHQVGYSSYASHSKQFPRQDLVDITKMDPHFINLVDLDDVDDPSSVLANFSAFDDGIWYLPTSTGSMTKYVNRAVRMLWLAPTESDEWTDQDGKQWGDCSHRTRIKPLDCSILSFLNTEDEEHEFARHLLSWVYIHDPVPPDTRMRLLKDRKIDTDHCCREADWWPSTREEQADYRVVTDNYCGEADWWPSTREEYADYKVVTDNYCGEAD